MDGTFMGMPAWSWAAGNSNRVLSWGGIGRNEKFEILLVIWWFWKLHIQNWKLKIIRVDSSCKYTQLWTLIKCCMIFSSSSYWENWSMVYIIFLVLFFIVNDFSKSRVDRIRTFKEIGCFFAGKGVQGERANQWALKKRKSAKNSKIY